MPGPMTSSEILEESMARNARFREQLVNRGRLEEFGIVHACVDGEFAEPFVLETRGKAIGIVKREVEDSVGAKVLKWMVTDSWQAPDNFDQVATDADNYVVFKVAGGQHLWCTCKRAGSTTLQPANFLMYCGGSAYERNNKLGKGGRGVGGGENVVY